jgi:hypothetical protein
MEHKILNPQLDVKLHDGEVAVRELTWPVLWQFLDKLSAHAGKLVGEDGKFIINAERIAGVVASSQDLSQRLILGTTGKDEEWLNKRPLGEVIQLLEASLEVNLSDSIIDRAKKIGSRLAGLFAGPPAKTISARS